MPLLLSLLRFDVSVALLESLLLRVPDRFGGFLAQHVDYSAHSICNSFGVRPFCHSSFGDVNYAGEGRGYLLTFVRNIISITFILLIRINVKTPSKGSLLITLFKMVWDTLPYLKG